MDRVAVLVLSLALLSCASAPPHEQDWLALSTPHFEIESSLDREATRELARQAELFHAAAEFALGAPLPAPNVPQRIVAFDDRSFERPFRLGTGTGYFVPSLRDATVVLRTGGGWDDDASEVLRRDYVDYLVRNVGGFGRHLWFEQGAAEFLSTVVARGEAVEVGRLREDHVELLRGEHAVPMDKLLRTADLESFGERRRAVFDAQSWLFVHYLNFGVDRNRGQGQLGRYLDLVGDGVGIENAVEEAFGSSVDGLDRRMQRYVRQERFDSAALRLPADFEIGEPRPVSRDAVTTRLGWLSLSLGRTDQAERHFAMALLENPQNARAHAGLGAAARMEQRWEDAATHFEGALSLAPDDALTHLDAGNFYAQQARVAKTAADRAGGARLARRQYARSAELDASLPETYVRFAETFLIEGEEIEKALAPAERAQELLPASLETRLLLARVYERLEKYAKAREQAVAVLSRSSSPETRDAARAVLERIGERARPREILKGSGRS